MRLSATVPHADGASHPVRRRWLGGLGYWAMQSLGWGLLGASLVINQLAQTSTPENPMEGVSGTALFIFGGLGCSHLLRVVILFLRNRCVSWWMLIAALVPALVLAGAALVGPLALLTALLIDPSIASASPPLTPAQHLSMVVLTTLLLGTWTVFYFGIQFFTRYRRATIDRLRLDAVLKEAELRALRSQVNPHFLFNSLNSLRALIPLDLPRPREAITLLADLLRAGLTMGQRHTILLSEELTTIESYLALEQLRYEDRLRVRREIDPRATGYLVPPFCVQTLVENAIKYGVEPFEEGGEIVYIAQLTDDRLCIEVHNRCLPSAASGTGVGLANARARLNLLFGPQADLAFVISPTGLATARITLPAMILHSSNAP